jgi:hypothetical protein
MALPFLFKISDRNHCGLGSLVFNICRCYQQSELSLSLSVSSSLIFTALMTILMLFTP